MRTFALERAICVAFEKIDQNPDIVPVAAVIFSMNGDIIATEVNGDGINHAEIRVIQKALCKQKYLRELFLYVTLEPCAMCAYAISMMHFKAVYFGAYSPISGGVENFPFVFDKANIHYYGGIAEARSYECLRKFFSSLR